MNAGMGSSVTNHQFFTDHLWVADVPLDCAKKETVYLLEKFLRKMSDQLHLRVGARTYSEIVFWSSVLFQTVLTLFQWTSVAGVDADSNLSQITKQIDLSHLVSKWLIQSRTVQLQVAH